MDCYAHFIDDVVESLLGNCIKKCHVTSVGSCCDWYIGSIFYSKLISPLGK